MQGEVQEVQLFDVRLGRKLKGGKREVVDYRIFAESAKEAVESALEDTRWPQEGEIGVDVYGDYVDPGEIISAEGPRS